MRKMLMIVLLIVSLFLISCVTKKTGNLSSSFKTLQLSEIEGDFELEDYTDLGIWLLWFQRESFAPEMANVSGYRLLIDGQYFEMKENPLKAGLFLAFIPETVDSSSILNGSLQYGLFDNRAQTRNGQGISIEYVYIQKSAAQNGTDLFKISLTDYMLLKTAKDPFLYENGKLLRPAYVMSSNGYVYTMKRYYDARQVSPSHDVNGAFTYLRNLPNYESYLFEEEPNIVSIESDDSILVTEPDTRDRIRDLGEMGDLNGNYTYDIVDDAQQSLFRVQIKLSELPAKYDGLTNFAMDIKSATGNAFNQLSADIVEATVSYDITTSTDVIKNARFYNDLPFAGGDGSQLNPFIITNRKQLEAVEDYLGSEGERFFFKQTEDIDLSGKDWEPLGDPGNPFYCSYEGNAKQIQNMTINAEASCSGLFSYIAAGATVTELELVDASITVMTYSGSLAGIIEGTVENCTITAYVTGSDGVTKYDLGGLSGELKAGAIVQGCDVTATMTWTNDGYAFGGIIGFNNTNATIERCSYRGALTGGGQFIGGIVGSNNGTVSYSNADILGNSTVYGSKYLGGFVGGNFGTISFCWSTGTLTGLEQTGGFVGHFGSGGAITNSYTLVAVSGGNYSGGFTGGFFSGSVIENCYAAGNGSVSMGFTGRDSGGNESNCFWDTVTSGTTNTAGNATGKTTTQMKDSSTFTGWDFTGDDAVWVIESGDNKSYPYLVANPQNPIPGFE